MKKLRLFVAMAVFGLAYWNLSHAQSAQEVAKKAFLSTVLLVLQDASGQTLSLGSGFVTGEGEVTTNLHVVRGASRGYARLVGQKNQFPIEGTLAVDAKRDLALLRVASVRWPPLKLGNSEAIQIGETVFAVGNPQGLEGTFSQGIISGIRSVGEDRLLQLTAPISPGSSGGPVLNQAGEVIGVSVATFRGGQNLNFAIESKYVHALRAKAGPVRPLATGLSSANGASILSDLGGRSTSGVQGGSFTWTYPGCTNCGGGYTFSIRNQLDVLVSNVLCLVVFYDNDGAPVEFDMVKHAGAIPPGLARRVSSSVDQSVLALTRPRGLGAEPTGKVEIRILDFRLRE